MGVLEEFRQQLRATPGCENLQVELASLDVTLEETVPPTLQDLFRRLGGADIVIANAGVNDITRVGQGDLAKEARMIRTNVIGAMATVDAAVEHFLARGSGQIVGISSLASLQPIKEQAAYCASKAGFSMYLKAARRDLLGKGIVISDILPGYVATDIVEGVDIGELPFAISADEVARQIVSLIEKRVERGIVPWFPWALIRPLIGHIPQSWLP